MAPSCITSTPVVLDQWLYKAHMDMLLKGSTQQQILSRCRSPQLLLQEAIGSWGHEGMMMCLLSQASVGWPIRRDVLA